MVGKQIKKDEGHELAGLIRGTGIEVSVAADQKGRKTYTINGDLALKESATYDGNLVIGGSILGTGHDLKVNGNVSSVGDIALFRFNVLGHIVAKGDINARDIDAGDIDARNINAWKIKAWYVNAEEVNVRDTMKVRGLTADFVIVGGHLEAGYLDVREIEAGNVTVGSKHGR